MVMTDTQTMSADDTCPIRPNVPNITFLLLPSNFFQLIIGSHARLDCRKAKAALCLDIHQASRQLADRRSLAVQIGLARSTPDPARLRSSECSTT